MATKKKADKASTFIGCTLKSLPIEHWIASAQTAARVNPINAPRASGLMPPERIAVLTTKYWGSGGVKLGVGFLDNPPADLRSKILSHMNAWGRTANVKFLESAIGGAQVRIAREPSGYWSYLGTDILHIPVNQQTMNLQGFTMSTPDSEFFRVVRHETGHTLGFPHEHMRADLVKRLDPAKTIAFFGATQGWSPDEVRAQVLTPLDESSLIGTPADVVSIMCYQLPGTITRDGQPIPGGTDIDASDAAFAARIYPPPAPPAPPPPPVNPPTNPAEWTITIKGIGAKPTIVTG